VPSNFTLTLAAGTKLTCAQAVTALLKHLRRWEVRSAGSGSKGERWYAWAWIATASPRHHLLVRRHLKSGDLAFHYCWVPDGQATAKPGCLGPGCRARPEHVLQLRLPRRQRGYVFVSRRCGG
jgi:hypothetical protein